MQPTGDYSLNVEYIFYRIYHFFTDGFSTGDNLGFLSQFADVWFWLRLVSVPLSLILTGLIIYLTREILALRHEERTELKEILEQSRVEKPQTNPAWEKVLEYMSGANPNEWKLGIIEADNLLDHLVKTMGYQGEGLGERLKNIEPSDFKTLQNAWEAHKVRNRIAHESGYVPTEHEARRAIANYRSVFEEFSVI